MSSSKPVVVDARGHMLGRLASLLAKDLLNGKKVVVTRCEDINISGSLFRNKIKFMYFLRKRMNTNPKKGPIHYRSPSRILWRTVRGMIPHKTARGKAAMERLKVFEGVPHPYDTVKRMVVPSAVKNLRLKPGRKFCRLGDLASHVGWRHNELITRLEDARKVKSRAYYEKKKEVNKAKAAGLKAAAKELAPIEEQLAALGYPQLA